jgi:hypothetical protein
MSTEIERPLCERCNKRPIQRAGYKLCNTCIGAIKRNGNPNEKRLIVKSEVEIESKRLLDELIRNNNVDIEVPSFDGDINPFEELLKLTAELTTWKNVCLAKVAKLNEDEWRWDGDRAGEQLRSEIVLYERAVKETTDLLVKIARLGIEERLTRIQERQVSIVETAIIRTLQELDLPVDMQAQARSRIIKHLKSS